LTRSTILIRPALSISPMLPVSFAFMCVVWEAHSPVCSHPSLSRSLAVFSGSCKYPGTILGPFKQSLASSALDLYRQPATYSPLGYGLSLLVYWVVSFRLPCRSRGLTPISGTSTTLASLQGWIPPQVPTASTSQGILCHQHESASSRHVIHTLDCMFR